MFGLRKGRDMSKPPVGLGSHLDTQPTGGKFDGVLGVLAGLEVLRTLDDAGIETAPRSASSTGPMKRARGSPRRDGIGGLLRAILKPLRPVAQRRGGYLRRGSAGGIGYRGATRWARRFAGRLELHIEQGPVLEAENKTIGVVVAAKSVLVQRRVAGPRTMPARRRCRSAATRWRRLPGSCLRWSGLPASTAPRRSARSARP